MRPRSRTISPDAYLDRPCGCRPLIGPVGVLTAADAEGLIP